MSNRIIDKSLSFFTKPNEKLVFSLDMDPKPISYTGDLFGKIEYVQQRKEITYIPDLDYSGTVVLFLNYEKNSNEHSVEIHIHIANTFKPRARIIKIIGQELISNDVIALVELIKNSYDADSENVSITLNDIFSDNGEIIVEDDGSGMTYEKVLNVWLEPATPDKKSVKGNSFSDCFQRRFLGEKGIGRFAVHRLGEKIELITRAKKNCKGELYDYETKVVIDWSDFTEDKYLSDIPIVVTKVFPPVTFTEKSGVFLRIQKTKPWNGINSIKEAAIKIRGLESPVKPQKVKLHKTESHNDPGINISFESNDSKINNQIKDLKTLKELLNTAFYKFNGLIDEDGTIIYDYTFDRIDCQTIKRSVEFKQEPLKIYNADWFESNPLTNLNNPGSFEVNFYAWDLEPATLKVAGLADYYRNIIKPNAGVRIYRDNFRVWPYGEFDDDWLGLDLKRLNEPKKRSVSRNQVFGVIHISSTGNNSLQDQSNREGLINNKQYEQFYQLVNAAMSVFAKERQSDKIKIEKKSKSELLNDSVTDIVTKLRSAITNNGHLNLYTKYLNDIEVSYKDKIDDIIERYMMAAAIGISYSIPIHEIKLRLSAIRHTVSDIKEHPELRFEFLKQLDDYLKETEDIITAVSSIMSKQKNQKISLYNVANNVGTLKQTDLKKYNIEYEVIGNPDIEVDAVPGLLSVAVLNLVDNAIYWLRAKKLGDKTDQSSYTPKISLIIEKNENKKVTLKVKDNGLGFSDPFDLIIEPYYSKKIDGLGLGLYLVNEIMIRIGGQLKGYNDNGAVFELEFQNT